MESLSSRIEASGAEIIREPLPDIAGDATLLSHLYENLLSNALKFTNGDRPVVRLTCERDGDQCILGVRDNGIGLKAEFAKKIFQPFQRLHGRGKYEGAGIGLAICQKVVDRHNGRIWVESQPGDGAHFKFVLGTLQESTLPSPAWFAGQPSSDLAPSKNVQLQENTSCSAR